MTAKKTDPAVELLYDNIHALSDPDFGQLNFMPFVHDSDGTRALKRKVSQAVVSLFRSAGYLTDRTEESTPAVSRDVTIHCRSCSALLLKTHVDESGRANVPAATILAALASMESDCPHRVITPEMQRQRIQDALLAAKAEGEQVMDLNELPALADSRTKQLGSLLSRMTGNKSEDVKFSRTQVNSIIEVLLPRVARGLPGMPDGMTCDVDKIDEDTWTLRISRPS